MAPERTMHPLAPNMPPHSAANAKALGPRKGPQRPRGAVRAKTGCYTCRIRRKKCDERQGENGCDTCDRLHLQCLGFGQKRPEWMRGESLDGIRERIKDFLAAQGLIKGQSNIQRSNEHPPQPPTMLMLSPGEHSQYRPAPRPSPPYSQGSSGIDSDDQIRRPVSNARDVPHTTYAPLPPPSHRTYDHRIQPEEPMMNVYGQQAAVPIPEPIYVGPTYDQEAAPYSVTVYQPQDFSFQPPLRSSFSHTYTDKFPDEEDTSLGPEQALILTTTAGPAQMSAELVSHYVQNVVKIQYLLADEGVYQVVLDAVNRSHLARDAVCKLAYLHQNAPSRRGLTWAEEQSANGLLTQTSEAVSQRGVFPDIGAALAALAMVSHVLFRGGRGQWREWLDIACGCVSILLNEQRYSSPADCLARCDALHRFVIMTTFWFDILASVTMSFPPRFLQEYRQLFDGGSVEGVTVEAYCDMRKVMGVENRVMLALAEISALGSQVAQSRKTGRPCMAELVRRGYEIETNLLHRPPKAESPISPQPYPFDVRRRTEQERTDYSRQLTGDIFRASARVYLASALSGDSPQNPDIAKNVRETVSCLRRVPDDMKHQVVRMVVFGICICGCLTDEPEHQRFLYDLLDKEAKGEVGNCGEVMRVMQAVWTKRRANPAVTVDWRQEMARLGGPDTPMILLV